METEEEEKWRCWGCRKRCSSSTKEQEKGNLNYGNYQGRKEKRYSLSKTRFICQGSKMINEGTFEKKWSWLRREERLSAKTGEKHTWITTQGFKPCELRGIKKDGEGEPSMSILRLTWTRFISIGFHVGITSDGFLWNYLCYNKPHYRGNKLF